MAKRRKNNLKTDAGQMLKGLETFAGRFSLSPPHMHVSDPIPDEETLKKGMAGDYHVYSRFSGHPDISSLEQWLCNFEGAAKARVFASGMAAITAALFATGEMRGPIHVIALLPLYGGTYTLLRKLARSPSHHFLVTFLSAEDPSLRQKLYDAIGPQTRAIIFEVSGNPTLTFPDIEKITHVAHRCARHIITICDSTFLFGLFKPLKWDIDVVVGSGTKYLVGESSWLMGYSAVSKNFLNDCPQFWNEIVEWGSELGGTLAPFEAWGTSHFCLSNLTERIAKQSSNALMVAKFLEMHPCVERVIYPGLESYPHRKEALCYLEDNENARHFGGMISFYIKNADLPHTMNFLYYLNKHTHIIHKASLGGPVDSVESPFMLSHAACDAYDNFQCGITRNNVRLSIGRGDPEKTMLALDEALSVTIP